MLRFIFIIFSILFLDTFSFAKDEYFLTLRYEKVNLRQGPSFEYPIKIFYKKKFLPVVIQDEYGNFRKIKDHENNSGWIHISQLSKKKSGINIKNNSILYKKHTIYSKPIVKIESGRLVLIDKCKINWCKVSSGDYDGWIFKNSLWGRTK